LRRSIVPPRNQARPPRRRALTTAIPARRGLHTLPRRYLLARARRKARPLILLHGSAELSPWWGWFSPCGGLPARQMFPTVGNFGTPEGPIAANCRAHISNRRVPPILRVLRRANARRSSADATTSRHPRRFGCSEGLGPDRTRRTGYADRGTDLSQNETSKHRRISRNINSLSGGMGSAWLWSVLRYEQKRTLGPGGA
jgi:hypothetical protein